MSETRLEGEEPMSERISQEDKNRVLFLYLVETFKTAAYQHMGKLKNPVTDKIERNLDQARFTIDLLDMLLVKTRGNLDEEEKRYLEAAVRELKLNYVDEVEKDRREREAAKQKETAASEEKTSSSSDASEPGGDEKPSASSEEESRSDSSRKANSRSVAKKNSGSASRTR